MKCPQTYGSGLVSGRANDRASNFCSKGKRMRRELQFLVDVTLVFAVIALAPFVWLMRDGLGPDAAESSGTQALFRCFMLLSASRRSRNVTRWPHSRNPSGPA